MASSQKLIVVLGATGTQGGSVVDTFVQDPAWRIRAITRNTSSPKAQALISKHPTAHIELVSADLNDVASLKRAFEGATAVFGVTDFWTLYGDEKIHAQAGAEGRPANELCFELEIQQGKNIFDAAAQTQGLERLVFSNLSNPSKLSGGKYKYVLHFDSKALAVEYGQLKYPELWAKTSLAQLGCYLENFRDHPFVKPRKNQDGTYTFVSAGSSASLWPMVAAAIETGKVTKALVELPAGKHVLVCREMMALGRFIETWSSTLGVQVKYGDGGIAAGMGQAPDALKREMEETFKYSDEFGFSGGDKSVIYPKDLGLNTGSVEEWIKAQDWSGVMGA